MSTNIENYEIISSLKDGHSIVTFNQCYGLINSERNFVLDCIYSEIIFVDNNKYLFQKIFYKDNLSKWFYIDVLNTNYIFKNLSNEEYERIYDSSKQKEFDLLSKNKFNIDHTIDIEFEEDLGNLCEDWDDISKYWLEDEEDNEYKFNEEEEEENIVKRFGCIDKQGNIIIPFEYDYIGEFINGIAKVKMNFSWGCINENGEIIIPFEYEEIGDFYNGIAKVKKSWGVYGFFNECGKNIIPCVYEKAEEFINGKARVKEINGSWGYIDLDGNKLVDSEMELPNGLIKGKKFERWGLRTNDNEIIIPYEYQEIGEFINGKAKIRKNYSECGYIDEKGKAIINCEYNEINEFINGKAKAKKDYYWGYIDETGNTIIPFEYDEIEEFSNGFAKSKKDWKWGYINEKNDVIIPLKYDSLSEIKDGLVVASKGFKYETFNDNGYQKLYGCIDLNGNIIIPFEFEELHVNNLNYIRAVKNNKWGVINLNCKTIISFNYEFLGEFRNNLFVTGKAVENNSIQRYQTKYGCIDINENVHIPFEYNEIKETINSNYIVILSVDDIEFNSEDAMLCGVLTGNGEVVIPIKYNEINEFLDGKFLVMKSFIMNRFQNNNKVYGVLNENGDVFVGLEYDLIIKLKNGKFKVKKNDKWGYLDESGAELAENEITLSNGMKMGQIFGFWGVSNEKGEVIIPYRFNEMGVYNNDRFSFKEDSLDIVVYFNEKGTEINELEIDFNEYLIKAKRRGKWGLFSKKRINILPYEFDEINDYLDGKILIKQKRFSNTYVGIFDKTGKVIIPLDYTNISDFKNGIYYVEKNGICGRVAENGEVLIENEVKLSNGLYKGEKFGKQGVRTVNGEVMIPYYYDNISDFVDGITRVEKDSKHNYIDENGKVLFSSNYELLGEITDGKIKVKDTQRFNQDNYNRCGIIDINEKIIVPLKYYKIGEFVNGIAKASIYHVFEYRDRDKSYEMFGFLDEQGNIIIPFEYEEIGEFINDKAKVRKSWRKRGYISENGQIIIPADYEDIGEFINGKAKTIKDGKFGFIDDNGNVLIANEFDKIEEFVDGKAKAYRKRIWGLIDEHGNEIASNETELPNGLIIGCKFGKWGAKSIDNITIIPYEFEVFGEFIDGKAQVKKSDNSWGYIDEKGIELVNNETELPNGLFKGDKFGRWGLRTINHNILLPYEYEVIGEFVDGKAKAKKEWFWGFIDESGNVLIPFDFTEIDEFVSGRAKAKKYDKYGFIDEKGNIIIPFDYYEIDEFINGKAKVKKGEWYEFKCGLIDESGNELIENEIELPNGLVIGEKFEKWGIESKDKNIILPFEYDYIGHKFVDGKTRISKDGNVGLINDMGEIIIPLEYKKIKEFRNGISIASKRTNIRWSTNSEGDDFEKHDTCYGCIDEKGIVIIPFEYKFIGDFINGKATARNIKDNWGLLDSNNKTIIPFIYKGMCRFENGLFKVRSNENNFGFINENGDVIIPVIYARIGRFFDGKALACLSDNGIMKYGCISEAGGITIPFEYEKLSYFVNGKAIAQRKWDLILIDDQNTEIEIKEKIELSFKYTTKEHNYDGLIEYIDHHYIIEINVEVDGNFKFYAIENDERELIGNPFNRKGISLYDWGSEALEVRQMDLNDPAYFGDSDDYHSTSYGLKNSFNGKSQWLRDNGDDSGNCDRDCRGCAYFTNCHG